MLSENANNYINRELRQFSVAEGNLTTAIHNNQKPQALSYIDVMRETLIHIRHSVRENMHDNKKR